jgi:hypothetical protein
MNDSQSIQFRVLPLTSTNDFEVRFYVNSQDLIEKHWPDMIGMDPDDVLSFDKLAPREEPHTVMVVRCGCGTASCANVTVKVISESNYIIWDCWDNLYGYSHPGTLIFDREQYLQAVRQALYDKSWETPDRTAARLLSSMIDRECLAGNSLSYQWASIRVKEGTFTVSVEGPPGYNQILVHIPWGDERPEQIAQKAAELLKKHPSQWPDVAWFGKISPPPFDGAGWRKFGNAIQAT